MPDSRRRTPRQARSRATVERILNAGTRVLETRGYPDASTNRIAREAAISPGSLYQYFPDKDAIVTEITHRLTQDFAAAIAPSLRQAAGQPPGAATRLVLTASLHALQARRELLRALVDRVPNIEQEHALQAVRRNVGDVVCHVLAANSAQLRQADIERATWTIVELTQQLLVRYVLDTPPIAERDFLADTTHTILSVAFRDPQRMAWEQHGRESNPASPAPRYSDTGRSAVTVGRSSSRRSCVLCAFRLRESLPAHRGRVDSPQGALDNKAIDLFTFRCSS